MSVPVVRVGASVGRCSGGYRLSIRYGMGSILQEGVRGGGEDLELAAPPCVRL